MEKKKKKKEQLPKTKLQAKMGSESSFEYEISLFVKPLPGSWISKIRI